ncbi:MAG: OmpA family protein [bacterium]|nr:OmpA family protein [bacterium]
MSRTLKVVLVVMAVFLLGGVAKAAINWDYVAPLTHQREGACAASAGGYIYVLGGCNGWVGNPTVEIERYDPGTNSWTDVDTIPTPRSYTACAAIGDTIYVIGGRNSAGDVVGTVEAFNTLTLTWTTFDSMPAAKDQLAVAAAADGKIYAIGGTVADGSVTNTVEAFDPSQPPGSQWDTSVPDLPQTRTDLAASAIGNTIYAIGGSRGSNIGDVDSYVVGAGSWSTAPADISARTGLSSVVVNGKIYALGGSSNITTVEVYDSGSNSWLPETPLNLGRGDLAVEQIGNIIYAIGGRSGGASQAKVEASKPNFSLTTKSARDDNGGDLMPGDTITYTIVVENSSISPANNVIIIDTIPANTTYVTNSISGGDTRDDSGNPVLSWEITTLDGGDSTTLTCQVTVNSSIDSGTVITNTATVSSNETDSGETNQTSNQVTSYPDLSTGNKSSADATGGDLIPGDTITYTITVRNTGSDTADNISITDTIPTNTTYVSGSIKGGDVRDTSGLPGLLAWTIYTLAPNTEDSVTFQVMVNSIIDSGDMITNTAFLDPDETGPVRVEDTIGPVVSYPDLSTSTKTAVDINGSNLAPGDTIAYTITVRNEGTDTATNILISDTIPGNTNYVTGSINGADTRDETGLPVLSWTINTLAPNTEDSVTFQVTVSSIVDSGAMITNTAVIDPTETGPVSVEDTLGPVISYPDLAASLKSSLDENGYPLVPGDTITYTITVRNSGSDTASNVVITDTIPDNTQYVTNSISGADTRDDTNLPGLTWRIYTLVPGAERVVSFRVKVGSPLPDGTVITNTALFDPAETGPITSNQTSDTVASLPDFSGSLKSSAAVAGLTPGDTITYTITVTNNGTDTAVGIVITDTIPANTAYVSGSITGTGAGDTNPLVLTWIISTMAIGGVDTLTYRITILSPLPDSTPITNRATIYTSKTGPFETNQTTDIVTSYPDLAPSTKTAVDINGGNLAPGDTIAYTITVRNEGTDTATNILISDTIPGNTNYVTGSINGADTRDETGLPVLSWTINTLAPNTEDSVTFQVTVSSIVDSGAMITNTAVIDPTETGPVSVEDTLEPVISYPDLVASLKSSLDENGNSLVPGDTITYTITVRNSGSDTATNVVITDTIPDNTQYVTNSISGADTRDASGLPTLTWGIDILAPGAEVPVSFQVTVNSPLSDSTVITNTALLDPAETGPITSNQTSDTVNSSPDFSGSLKSSTAVTEPTPGDTITYTITVTNNGTDTAVGIVITDTIPANTAYVSGSITGTGAGDTNPLVMTWIIPTMAIGGVDTLTYRITIHSPLPDSTPITNRATIYTSKTGPFETNETIDIVRSYPDFSHSAKSSLDENGGALLPGDNLLYTITVVNTGTDTATSVVVTDTVPENTAYVPGSITGSGANASDTSLLFWTFLTLEAGDGETLTYRVRVNDTVPDGTEIKNTAAIDSFETGPIETNETMNTVAVRPDLSRSTKVSADVNGGNVSPGDTLTYTITVRNRGGLPATNILVTDTIPANTTYLTGSITGGDTYSEFANILTWEITTLDIGADTSLSFKVRVNSPLSNGSHITNTATLDPSETGPVVIGPTDDEVVSFPDLSSSTKASADVNGGDLRPGDTLAYTITLRNTGTDTATSILVTDTIPANTSYLQGTITGGDSRTDTAPVMIWGLTSLAVGEEKILSYQVKLAFPLDNGTNITNTALVETAETGPVTTSPTLNAVTSSPDFSLTLKTVDNPTPNIGDTLTYTILVKNTGDMSSTGTKLQDNIPEFTTYIPESTTLNDTPLADIAGLPPLITGMLVNSPGDTAGVVRALSLARVTFQVTVDTDLPRGIITISNQGIALSDQPGTTEKTDADSDDDSDNPTLAVVTRPDFAMAHLAVDKPTANPGEIVTYTVTIPNQGNINSTNTIYQNPMPANTVYLPNSTTMNGSPVSDVSGMSPVVSGMLINSPGEATGMVEVNDTAVITYRVRIALPLANGTLIPNQGVVTSSESLPEETDDDFNDENGDDPTDVTIKSTPDFSRCAKTVDNPIPTPGQTITYTIVVPNNGNMDATKTTLIDLIPDSTTYVLSSTTLNGASVPDTAGTSPLVYGMLINSPSQPEGTVVVDAAATITFSVTINEVVAENTIIENQGQVESEQPITLEETDNDGNEVNGNRATKAIVVWPGLAIAKQAGVDFANPAAVFTYTIYYGNTDHVDATEVVISDTLPEEVEYITGSATGPVDDSDSTCLTWNIGSMSAGVTGRSVTYQVKVKEGLANGTIIPNLAVIDSKETLPKESGLTEVEVTSLSEITFTDETGDTVEEYSVSHPVYIKLNDADENEDANRIELIQVTLTDPVTEDSETVILTETEANSGIFTGSIPTSHKGGNPGDHVLQVESGNTILVVYTDPNDSTDTSSDRAVMLAPILEIDISGNLDRAEPAWRANPGDVITFTINYVNTGPVPATEIEVLAPVPTDLLEYVPGSIEGPEADDSIPAFLYWYIGDLLSGEAGASLTYQARVKEGVSAGTIISNIALIQSLETLTTESLPFDVEVTSTSKTSFTDEAGQEVDEYSIGKPVYIRVTDPDENADTEAIETITVTVIDPGTNDTETVSLTETEPGSGIFTGSLPTSPAGRAGLAAPAAGDGTLQVQGGDVIQAGYVDPDDTTDTSTAQAGMLEPSLVIEISADPLFANPGEVITYTITYGNEDHTDGTEVVITNTLPAEVEYIAETITGDGDDSDTTHLVWNIGTVTSGSVGNQLTYRVRVKAGAPAGTIITNSAVIEAKETLPIESDPVDVKVTSFSSIRLLDTGGEETDQYSIGGPVYIEVTDEDEDHDTLTAETVTVTVVDPVTGDTEGVTLTETDPASGIFIGSLATNPGSAVFSDGTLQVSGGDTIEVTYTDPDDPSDTSAASAGMLAPTLTIEISVDPDRANPGDVVTYTIICGNMNHTSATLTVVENTLPAELEYVAGSISGPWADDSDPTHLRWDLGTVSPLTTGITLTYDALVKDTVPAGTIITNSAVIDSKEILPLESEPISLTVTSFSSTRLLDAGGKKTSQYSIGDVISIEVTDEDENQDTGTTETVTVTVIDPVTGDTETVTLTETGPASGIFISLLGLGTDPGDTLPGDGILQVSEGDTVEVTYTDPDDPSDTSAASAGMLAPTLSIGMEANVATANPGDIITYTITCRNINSVEATGVIVTNTLPSGVEYIPGSITGDGADTSDSARLKWNLSTLLSGGGPDLTLGYQVKVLLSVPVGTVITNRATIDSRQTLPRESLPVEVTVTSRSVTRFTNETGEQDEDEYLIASPIYIEVTDKDENKNSAQIENITVTVTNPIRGDTETVSLYETGKATGIFSGNILTGAGSVVPGDGTLQVDDGDTIIAAYTDPNDPSDTSTDRARTVFAGRVEGRIIDGYTHLPVPGIDVSVTDLADNYVGEDVTDTNGRYSVPVTQPGDYLTRVTLPGDTEPAIYHVTVTEPGVPARPANSISGIVKDRVSGETMPGVTLTLQDWKGNSILDFDSNPVVVTTNAKSHFFAANLPAAGVYYLAVTEAPAGYFTADPVNFPWYRLKVTGGEEKGTVIINITDLIDPYGYVFDAKTGKRLAGVPVELLDSVTGNKVGLPTYQGQAQDNPDTTDAGGNYAFMVNNRLHKLRVTAGLYEGKYYQAYQTSFSIEPNEGPVNLNIPLSPESPDLGQSTKSVTDDNGGDVLSGDILTYLITVKNTGLGGATGVMISDTLPEFTDYVSGATSWRTADTFANGVLTFNIGSLANQSDTSVTFKVKVKDEVNSGTEISNIAAIRSDQTDPVHTNNGQPVVTIVTKVTGIALELEKTANKRQASIGDIITYTINLGPRAGVTEVTGVEVIDTMPAGFRYLEGTTLIDGQKTSDPVRTGRRLQFSLGDVSSERSITYRLVIGSGVIRDEYINLALAYKDGRPVSNEDRAKVEVIENSFLDAGLIIGKVFWDKDGNGYCDSGEEGIPGAMVAMDNGTYSTTDPEGKYRLYPVRAGQRAVKVNAATLPPGATFTTEESRIVSITEGLTAKVNFGVGLESREPEKVEIKTGMLTAEERINPVVLSGDVREIKAKLNGRSIDLLVADCRLQQKYLIIKGDELAEQAVFMPYIRSESEITDWTLTVLGQDRDLINVIKGTGHPPAQIAWDGRDRSGNLIRAGQVYWYQLKASNKAKGMATHDERVFGVKGERVISIILRGTLFDTDRYDIRPDARKSLKETADTLRKYPYEDVVIEGHTDSRASDAHNLILSQNRATSVKNYLVKEEGIDEDRLTAVGYGERKPVASNDTPEGMQLNRRVEIKSQASEVELPPETDRAIKPAKVIVNGVPVTIDENMEFFNRIDSIGLRNNKLTIEINNGTGLSSSMTVTLPALTITGPSRPGGPVSKAISDEISSVVLTGRTDPGNKVMINNFRTEVSEDGSYSQGVPVKDAENTYRIVVTNPEGYSVSAEQKVTPAFKVETVKQPEVKPGEPEDYLFLVAIADGTIGQMNTEGNIEPIEGDDKYSGDLYSDGRVAYYLKGRIKGRYLIASSLDTDRKDEKRLLTNLDPDRYYPIYGDSSNLTYDADSQELFYLRVDRDQSHFIFGDYATGLNETELAGYNRTLYGGKLQFQSVSKTKDGDPFTKVILFGAEAHQRSAHNEFRGTGGSLYYLKHDRLAEGSEKVRIEVRDKDTGRLLSKEELKQNIDYNIKYEEGRIIFKQPIPSVTEANTLIDGNILPGHSVWVVIDYEYQVDDFSQGTYGGRVRQHLTDSLAIGASYAGESRDNSDYQLQGADVTLRASANTKLTAEYARSQEEDTENWISVDGGMGFSQETIAADKEGNAVKITGSLDLAEWMDGDLNMRLGAYYQKLEAGFSANGSIQENGLEKAGGEVAAQLFEGNAITLKYERIKNLTAPEASDERSLITLQASQALSDALNLTAEFQQDNPEGVDAINAIAGQIGWRISDRLKAGLAHQQTLDDKAKNNQTIANLEARLNAKLSGQIQGTTGSKGESALVGLNLKVNERLSGQIQGATGSAGESALVGVKARVSDKSNLYLDQTFSSSQATTIFGAETILNNSTRTYAQYELSSAIDGKTSRSVVGLNNKFELSEGLFANLSFEHSGIKNGSKTTRDAGSVALEYLASDLGKASTKLELRRDDGPGKEQQQFLTTNAATLKLSPNLSLLGKVNYSLTEDKLTNKTGAESREAGIGLAYRPVDHDWVNLLARYTNLVDQRPATDYKSEINIASLEGAFDLGRRFQLVERFADKREKETRSEISKEAEIWLWINRLNYHLTHQWDAGLEYRLLAQKQADDRRKGFLVEVNRQVVNHLWFGAGYNFTDFTDKVNSANDYSAKGWFLRLQGNY